ncbi:hypothetical protein OKE80_08685 [Riemerella anatipestifer]|uniref:hypothetical protein n=1 Tax=Riemerella anatipestifer TaxID=34085 RepID=UPI0007EC3F56|nr:hypothetical protein [Riemerella anatipestifer]AZZ57960.1 hypothetical protein AWB57_02300 [Riemerella anatipestifer]MBT0572408.1 hypothetical protein [Riemerella anatipestifer]MCO7319393.1 hypothetical protein [Riemerella anatipestifer]MCQ4155708.1 hypothetical protein [Riemerella anatipestifer]MCQ4181646.1 hypothetical protein [Riemerella anatipestifer]
MKRQILNLAKPALVLGLALGLTSCNRDETATTTSETPTSERMITVAGAIMGQNAGDGNGGTILYSISKQDAKDPNKSFNIFENGFLVRSERTARLQSSEDGTVMFNIAYAGANGGEYSRYRVKGGNVFEEFGAKVNISQYATTSPRWVKLFDGDKTGVAVNVQTPVVKTGENNVYQYTRGIASIVSLDLQESLITNNTSFEIPLSAEEEKLGHHIFRLDAPTLNKAKNKLIIGTWLRKTNPATGTNQSTFERLGSKSVIVDYPSLKNPKVITSTVGFGDTSGYRSFNSFLGEDGNIYQATQRDSKGSHILKINSDNEYDNSYVFSLDAALGVKGSYIECWRYAGNGIAYVMYTHIDAPTSATTNLKQSFLARVDLKARTASKVDLPYDADLYFFQYQGMVVDGDEVFITFAPVGKDGNIYILNSKTGSVTKGAKLINKTGNHFIGAF